MWFKTGRSLLWAIMLLGSASGAEAWAAVYTVTPTGGDAILIGTSNSTANLDANGVETLIKQFIPAFDTELTEVYKADLGTAANPATVENGSFASSYTTTYDNEPLDPQDALVTWDGPDVINHFEKYLIVKDGNQIPAQYVFNISSWNGIDDLCMLGFWPNQGAISHIGIYVGPGRPTQTPGITTPEPASFALWGGFLGLGLLAGRRRLKAAV